MTAMRHVAQRLLLGSFLAFPGVAWAGADVTVGGTASANVGYSSNPFAEVGSDTGSGFVQIQATPEIDITTEKNNLTIGAAGQYKKFFREYDDTYDYNGYIDYKGTPSSLIQDHLKIKYDSAVIGEDIQNTGTSTDPVLSGSDLTLFGTRDRVQKSQANGDVKFTLSAKDTLTFAGYYLLTRYDQSYALNDYDGYGGSVGYSRLISANLQLGAQGSVAHYVYRYIPGGNTTVYSPQVTFSDALTAYWSLKGAVGVSFIDRDIGGSTTTLSGNLDLCRSTARSDFCLTALRAVLPTGSSGSQNELLAGIKYSYKITSRDTISSDLNYTKNSGILTSFVLPSAYLRGDITYKRALTEKIDMILQGKYSHIVEDSSGRSADYGGQFGISVKIGTLHNAQ